MLAMASCPTVTEPRRIVGSLLGRHIVELGEHLYATVPDDEHIGSLRTIEISMSPAYRASICACRIQRDDAGDDHRNGHRDRQHPPLPVSPAVTLICGKYHSMIDLSIQDKGH